MLLKIILGLLGLGVVVFVHELGHFLAARAVGIDVEAFALGWGRAFLKKKIGNTEYRLCMFPVGGYCKMKGEHDGREAGEPGFAPEPGSFFAAHPLKRVLVAFAGPFFNIVFAVFVFSVIWGVGFETPVLENRIVLVSDISGDASYPANAAGLQTGDRIIEINGKPCENHSDVQQMIALNPDKPLKMTAQRDGKLVETVVTPVMDRSTGAGKIGVYFWTDPVIGAVTPGGPAERAGLLAGDRILSMGGEPFPYSAALYKRFAGLNEDEMAAALALPVEIEWERGGQVYSAGLALQGAADLGLDWRLPVYKTPRYSPIGAIARGAEETWTTFSASVRSLSLFFKGIDLTQAVSGPVRITYMVGDIATNGFAQGAGSGLRSVAEFLSFISIALCVMNLLPLPILDGGLIVLYTVEAVRRRPAPARLVSVFQMAGIALIAGLMLFAVFGDILFLTKQ